MATVKYLALLALVGCGDIQNYGGDVPPLVTFTVEATGDLAAVRPPGDTGDPSLHAALIWADQFLIEPLCVLPPESDAATAVIKAGCRDPFGFVPSRVALNVPVELDTPATLSLFTLPGADVMVGDLTARVAYGTLVIYDDKDGDGTLSLGRPNRPPVMQGPPDTTPTQSLDLVYAASFVTMTGPDQRVAFREGAFVQSGFYPRAGCSDPPPAFSLLGAGGFTAEAAIAATLAGMLPLEDPASCSTLDPASSQITLPVQPPASLAEVRCTERRTDSSVRYREATTDGPDLTDRTTACVHVPTFGPPSDVIELVVSGRTTDSCVGLTHYLLKGCRNDPNCSTPEWDHSAAPPDWWPCGT